MNIVKVIRAGIKLAEVVPEPVGRGLFNVLGTVVGWSGHGGVRQLRKNLQRVQPLPTQFAQYQRSASAMRAYMRYYYEIFRLPSLTGEQIDARLTIEGHETLKSYLDRGVSVSGALMHMGNWDIAGAWSNRNLATVHTIAEKLDPPELADIFYDFRESLGMKIYQAVKGGGAISKIEADMKNGLVFAPLLCDRDLSASGIEVNLCGRPVRVAVGAALLAQRTGTPMFPVSIVASHFPKDKERIRRAGSAWGVRAIVGQEIYPRVGPDAPHAEREADLRRMNQEWMDQMSRFLPEHAEQWHMLQKVFVEDLDQDRLAANRAARADREAQ